MAVVAHQLKLTADLSAVAASSAWIRSLGGRLPLAPGDVFRLDLCVTELITNIADHGYAGRRAGLIELSAQPDAGGAGIRVEIIDDGDPFDPLVMPSPAAPSGADGMRVGGLGIHLIRTYADDCRYERRGERNVFTFTVRRSATVREGTPEGPVNRGVERRHPSVQPSFPLTRTGGIVVTRDQRAGGERRLLGFISTCELFRNVPYMMVEDVIARCAVRELERGSVLLHPGDRNYYVVLVVRGSLRVQLGTDDAADYMEIMAGACTGEMSVIDGKPVSAHVVAATDCRLLLIDSETFLTRVLPVPEVARNLVGILADRMRRSNDRIIERVRSSIELEALQRELHFAHDVQTSMVPERMALAPARPEVQCSGFMRPARQVGGDFYDAFYIEPDRIAVVIGDVCGKGMPAALFMSRTMTLLRSEGMNAAGRTQRHHTVELMERANRHLCRGNDTGFFASIFVAILDVSTGVLTWVNAGHPAPALARGSSDFRFIAGPRGVLLGVDPGARYAVGETGLPPGSTMLIYTDGVTEAEDAHGGMFGDARLLGLLNDASNRDAGALIDVTVEAVDHFARGHAQSDDLTLLALRYTGPS